MEKDLRYGLNQPLPPPRRYIRKGAAAFDRLIEDVAWLKQELAWLAQRTTNDVDDNWTLGERVRGRLIVSLIKELQAPIAQYFEVMPIDPEREWLDAPLRMVVEAGKQVGTGTSGGKG
jgi:hypothetical protein